MIKVGYGSSGYPEFLAFTGLRMGVMGRLSILTLAVPFVLSVAAWAGTCTDPNTGRILEWGPGESAPDACRIGGGRTGGVPTGGGGHRTPGLLDKVFGGGGRQDSWQNTLNQENAGAAADNARIDAEHQAYLQRKAAERARQEPEAVSPAPPTAESNEDMLGMMRGLGSRKEAKNADDDLPLRGFDPSAQEMPRQSNLKTCSDCLGVYNGESKSCDAITGDLFERSACLDRAAGVWKRCVAAVDCPGSARPKLPRKAETESPKVSPASGDFVGSWYLCKDRDSRDCSELFGRVSIEGREWTFESDKVYRAEGEGRHLSVAHWTKDNVFEHLSFEIAKDGRHVKLTRLTWKRGGAGCEESECEKEEYLRLVKR